MLEDYIYDDHLRYEGHKLIYTFSNPTEEPLVIGGILGAVLLCVRLINTDEQVSREIVLDEHAPTQHRYGCPSDLHASLSGRTIRRAYL